MPLPLTSVTVLDMADAPMILASRLLADLGADVIRVEDADGDHLRRRGPFVHLLPGVERSLAHIRYNAGKRSVALALGRPEAWEIVREMARHADIAFVPMEPRGQASPFFEALHDVSPRLGIVEAVLRRNATRGAVTDLIGTAAGGMLVLNGEPNDPPNHPAGELAYKQTSLAAALAAVSLLLNTQAGGAGGRVTVSMQEAMMWTTIQSANENYWYWHQQRPGRRGLAGLGGRTIFQAGDGEWVSFYQHPPSWESFVAWVAEALGERPFEAPEWRDDLHRLRNFAQVVEVTTRLCASLPRADLVREAQRRAILVVPVQGVMDIARDPHLRARDFFQTVPYPQLGMDLEVMRPPFISSDYRASARRAPMLGEHSGEVLAGLLGMDAGTIETLSSRGIVRHPAEVSAQ